MNAVTVDKIKSFKNSKKSFTAITAYDYTSAKIIDSVNIPLILVGDSASMVSYGYTTTVPVSMDEILLISRAVSRGTQKALVVGDMPFLSYQSSVSTAIKNAGLFLKNARVGAVKLEGGLEIIPQIKKIISSGIPVMGHVGLTPQSVNMFSGYKVQGKNLSSAQKILDEARAIEAAGAFSIVLECIPTQLAEHITKNLSIPTIGIGSGPYCDGQIQVYHDILGLMKNFSPKHTKKYSNLYQDIKKSLKKYSDDVMNKKFPTSKHSFAYQTDIIDKLK